MSYASKMLSHRALRHRHIFGYILFGLIIVWGLAWGGTAYHMNRKLDSLIKQAAEKGITITTAKYFINGNPWSIHAHFEPFSVYLKNGNEIKAQEAVFYLNLWDWNAVSGKLRKGIEATVMGTSLTAGIIRFGFERPARASTNITQSGLTLWVQPLGVDFSNSYNFMLGNQLEEAHLRFRIMGSVPDFTKAQSVSIWKETGGLIEFDRFYIHWGPLTITAHGSLGLDANLQPEGAFSSRITGFDETIGILAMNGKIKEHQIPLLRSAMNILSRPSSITGQSSSIVPLSVQSGQVYFGPIKLMEFPTITWE